ncbi:non-homologous end joining protein Ku [Microvirga alba]|uniref:Non-homologous end joining protein Ku n=1 Tax=Microvirga alba TaxID=2791025 RepID=A0A931BT99_9HYPH|nr:Ku protein [Microvirga alba]MBF9232412.1 Ku protein [Microvirga alba]
MVPRANWKGFLKIAELACPVALYTAASTSERMAFHVLNRETGHRVQRQFVDAETGKAVAPEDQVKGYEIGNGEYVIVEPDEIAAVIPESDKTLAVEAFVACRDIDDVYFDRPYYLAPTTDLAEQAFALVREGMRAKDVAAIARAVLFRRVRTVLIRSYGAGLIATTLNFNYQVRSAKDAFDGIPEIKTKGEMLDLAKHIIDTKRGTFDPKEFKDRYEAALTELVRAKLEGKPIQARKAAPAKKAIDLMEALRQSAGVGTPTRRSAGKRSSGSSSSRDKGPAGKAKSTARKRASSAASHRRKAG